MNKKLEVTQVNRFHVIELDRPEVLGWLVWEIKSAERVARVRDKGVWPPSLCSQFFHASLHLAATGRGAVGSSRPTTRKRGRVGWPPYCSPPFMKRPPIVLHAESDPRGRTELPGLCAESLARTLLHRALLPHLLLPPALGLGGGARAPGCARVPPKSRETRRPPLLLVLLPPPPTSFPLTSRRCCSKNKGRDHRSRCRAWLGSPEPRPTPASSGAAYGRLCVRPAGPARPAGAVRGPPPKGATGVLGGRRQRPEEALPARCGSSAPEASRCPGGYRAALEAERLAREGGGTRPSGGLLYQSTGFGGRVSDLPHSFIC
ncbi:hypothetical protein EI555_009296 [Monodon monoceros]|uniref:Uncharacterized protein n=1 Tax=Monodon monoceros TaxID=40151 RepID=A0A4U1EY49_MONMO|nr:hypothetical protein EI555_009296 [Monodon monoceros]